MESVTTNAPPALNKLVDIDTLSEIREQARADGKTVAWTNGCFDLLHVGHVRNLQAAHELADMLIVGLNGDESVRRIKGPSRPIVPAAERAEVLCALECVDYVVIFDETTPEAILARIQPEIHCKGAEYAPPLGKPIVEAGVVESYGGRIVFLPMVPANSTTDVIRRIREQAI
jgi:rfaE bifunctional protein nucleotidyltransferase chain/domain